MNFDFSDDQKMLREQARKFLDETSSRKAVREVLNDPGKSYDAALWKAVAEQGWLGVAIPEAFGGLGLGGLELCVLAEEIGRAVAPIPFSSTLYFFGEAVRAAGSAAQKKALLPQIASGDLIGAFAISEGPGAPSPSSIEASFDGSKLSGIKIPVTDGDIAAHAVVLAREGGGLSLVLVDLDQPGVKRETLATLDPTRGIELGRSNAYYGAWALSTESAQLPLAAAAARIAASDAYYLAAKENIQAHGGMGFTWEVDCHLFYRRAKLLAVQAGGPGVWKEKLVRRLENSNAA
jgi:alkylation response protein AidB-like acyl-CoA dehydrogenase